MCAAVTRTDPQVAVVGAGDVAGYRETETRAAARSVAAGVESDEAFEDAFMVGQWDPGSVVRHVHGDRH